MPIFATSSTPARQAAIASLAVVAAGIAGRRLLPANTDVSWLITVAEKVIDGARLYVDIPEPNPPMSIYLYAPAVLLGRLFGAAPEAALDVVVFALAIASVAWCAPRLPRAPEFSNPWLAPAALAVLLVLPAYSFGQREHLALVAFLPWMTIAIRRAEAAPTPVGWAVVGGLCGGLALAIKPHFALALAGATCVSAASTRSWKTLFKLENLVAGGVLVAYLAHIPLFYPAYGRDLGPLLSLYISVRQPVWRMLFGAFPMLTLELAGMAAFLAISRGKAAVTPWVLATAAAVVGFLAAAIIQGKGWPYHFLPAFGLATLLLAALSVRRPSTGRLDIAIAALGAAFFFQSWRQEAISVDLSPIHPKILAVKSHPRVMTMASDPAVSFPTTRAVGGVWADQQFNGMIPYYAGGLAASDGFDPARLPALRAMVEAQRRDLALDLRRRRADVLLIERKPFDYVAWGRRDPEISGLLDCFRDTGSTRVGDPDKPGEGLEVSVWAAVSPPPAQGGCAAGAPP